MIVLSFSNLLSSSRQSLFSVLLLHSFELSIYFLLKHQFFCSTLKLNNQIILPSHTFRMKYSGLLVGTTLMAVANAHSTIYNIWVDDVDQSVGNVAGGCIRYPPNNNPVKDIVVAKASCIERVRSGLYTG
jgi:hypothetical protein